MDTTTAFPRTLAAVKRCRTTLAEQNRIAAAIGTSRHDRQQRVAEAAHDDANRAALAAYATELLPAILGGSWQRAEHSLIPYGRPAEADLFRRPWVDHVVTYRRTGTAGPLTWCNGAMLSEPYDAFTRDGQPRAEAIAQAHQMRVALGVGIWASRRLSRWYPGWTALVVVARDLPADPELFGFVALHGPRPTDRPTPCSVGARQGSHLP